METHTIRLKERTMLTDDVMHLTFDWVTEPVSFKAGQYFMFRMTIKGRKIKAHKAYSIASPPRSDELEFCVKVLPGGEGSTKLKLMEPGEELDMVGPMGHMFIDEPEDKDMVFIAAGTGVAPFRSMIMHLLESGFDRHIWLLLGARTEDTVLYRDLFQDLSEKHDNFTFVPVLSRQNWEGEMGYVQERVSKYVEDPERALAFLCGLPRMVEETRQTLEELGFDRRNVLQEKYV